MHQSNTPETVAPDSGTPKRGVAHGAVIACILWGSAFAGAKIGLEYAPPLLLSGLRFTLAGLMLIPVMMWRGIHWVGEIKKHWRFMLLFGTIQTGIQYGLFFLGIDKVEGATSSIIVGAGPLFIAIMAHLAFKNDKMTLRKMLAIALGLSGVVFISLAKGKIAADNPGFYSGVALLLLSVWMGGFTNIMVAKKKSANISPYALTAVAHFVGGVLLLGASLAFEAPQQPMLPLSPRFLGALTWLAFISGAGFSIWYGLLNRPEVKVSELNIWKFIIPVTGSILSWLLIPGEHPDLPAIIGMVVICVALVMVQLPDKIVLKFGKTGKISTVNPEEQN